MAWTSASWAVEKKLSTTVGFFSPVTVVWRGYNLGHKWPWHFCLPLSLLGLTPTIPSLSASVLQPDIRVSSGLQPDIRVSSGLQPDIRVSSMLQPDRGLSLYPTIWCFFSFPYDFTDVWVLWMSQGLTMGGHRRLSASLYPAALDSQFVLSSVFTVTFQLDERMNVRVNEWLRLEICFLALSINLSFFSLLSLPLR